MEVGHIRVYSQGSTTEAGAERFSVTLFQNSNEMLDLDHMVSCDEMFLTRPAAQKLRMQFWAHCELGRLKRLNWKPAGNRVGIVIREPGGICFKHLRQSIRDICPLQYWKLEIEILRLEPVSPGGAITSNSAVDPKTGFVEYRTRLSVDSTPTGWERYLAKKLELLSNPASLS